MIYKCVMVVRGDLDMSKGKIVSQCIHGITEALHHSTREKVDAWQYEGEAVIIVKVKSLDELVKVRDHARSKGIFAHIVHDNTLGTGTICVVGPDIGDKVDKITSQLKLL